MRYTWDQRKNAANARKHGIRFEVAALIFEGPIFERPDERHDYGEERCIAFGVAQGQEIAVVYVDEDEDTRRIISARATTRRERALYWKIVGK
jgi:uncharacterized DUF497 family protein